eukprot:6211408-Pleurochrysis_carterae.AAC.1
MHCDVYSWRLLRLPSQLHHHADRCPECHHSSITLRTAASSEGRRNMEVRARTNEDKTRSVSRDVGRKEGGTGRDKEEGRESAREEGALPPVPATYLLFPALFFRSLGGGCSFVLGAGAQERPREEGCEHAAHCRLSAPTRHARTSLAPNEERARCGGDGKLRRRLVAAGGWGGGSREVNGACVEPGQVCLRAAGRRLCHGGGSDGTSGPCVRVCAQPGVAGDTSGRHQWTLSPLDDPQDGAAAAVSLISWAALVPLAWLGSARTGLLEKR